MGLNSTPAADRLHIGFFGRRNAGKSSLVNAVTGQNLAIVSDTKGTTTDPVYKTMELLPLGPVMIIDTPGFDDEGELGLLRVKKTRQVLNKTDIAVLVVDAKEGMSGEDEGLLDLIKKKEIPYVVVYNKSDLLSEIPENEKEKFYVSAKNNTNIYELKENIASLVTAKEERPIVSDLIESGDTVLLITPIDSSAPKGRLILPQQQTIRDILDKNAVAVVAKETEIETALSALSKKPKIVITDSQVFSLADEKVPQDILLTSFSILMARKKGFLETAVEGVSYIERLKDGDRVLIAEGCTHHRQCNDIGTVKIPNWLKKKTGKDIIIETVSGTEFPEDLSPYSLIIHCGGCMIGEREVKYRMKCAKDWGVPITNYGTAIAYMQGILERSIRVFPDLAHNLE